MISINEEGKQNKKTMINWSYKKIEEKSTSYNRKIFIVLEDFISLDEVFIYINSRPWKLNN